MSRPLLVSFVVLAVALLSFGLLADRALVREAATATDLAITRTGQDARAAVLSVRGALGQIEQEVLGGRRPVGIEVDTLALPPAPSISTGRPYRGRPSAELEALLLSTDTTPSGLPEAAVAATVLGTDAAIRMVAERLLRGELPVRPDDVVPLARVLGVADDPRLANLARRLARVPQAFTIPEAPSFRRRLEAGAVEGWARRGHRSLHYEAPTAMLLAAAGVEGRAEVIRGDGVNGGVAVPDVDGFILRMRPDLPSRERLHAARGLLWLAVSVCLTALVLVARALSREALAVAREKRFVAGITHELRTPVTAIRVFGETLAEGRGDPREYGALVAVESERLEALVERVLAVTRLDEAPFFADVQPAEVLRSAVHLMTPRAARRGVALRTHVDADVGSASWDADGVRRALLNLIDNAVKHGRENGAVSVGLDGADDVIRFSVRDDGPGIARRDHRKVFERFQRGTTDAAGAGLGLYLVDQVARAHGGRVDLMSREGEGCTFTLVLPRRPA